MNTINRLTVCGTCRYNKDGVCFVCTSDPMLPLGFELGFESVNPAWRACRLYKETIQ